MAKNNRIDISEWIIHFVHDRNPDNDANEYHNIDPETGDADGWMPDDFSYVGKPIYKTIPYEEEYYGLEPDTSAFPVLKKILHNGYIRSGWSFRNHRPTIYGPKSAVCFTEMPLYGLLEYAKSRNARKAIQDYGIAFLRGELFKAGARPVIYGLSSAFQEAKEGDPFYNIGLRTLSSSCGIGLKEQYRYVSTNLGGERYVDWTHEREWRWADISEEIEYDPGMPFYSKNDYFSFSKMIIITKDNEEAEDILELLKHLYDAKTDEFGREFDTNLINNTYVLSIESLKNYTGDLKTVRIDDLPILKLPKIREIKVSEEILTKVKLAWEEANKKAYLASEKLYNNFPSMRDGERLGPAGFSNVVTYHAYSEITQALVKLNIAKSHGEKYILWGLSSYPSQLLDIEEEAAKVAAEFMQAELGQSFYYESRMD